jgi:hypothetical protein
MTMFITNSLGDRCKQKPFRLRYLTDEEQKALDGKTKADKATAAAAFLAEQGFPQNTPVADMTDAQQASYWRAESKKQQKRTEGLDLDKLRKDSEDLEKLRKHGLDDHQRAIEEATENARREGENIGAEKYLKDAVTARFQHLTGKTDEEVATTFAHVDPKSFTDDAGVIDVTKLKAFADTFGTSSSNSISDPVREALERNRQHGGGGGGSVSDIREQAKERLSGKKQ